MSRRSPLRSTAGPSTRRTWRPSRWSSTCSRPSGSPHHQVGIDGSRSCSPSRRVADGGQVGHQRGVLQDAGAQAVDDAHPPAAHGLDQAGDAELGVAAQLERVAPGGVDAAQDDVDALEAAEDPHLHPAVAHDEVAALHEREAERGGDERLVVRRLRLAAGRQDDHPRVGEVAGGALQQRRAQGAEERLHPVQPGLAVELGQHPRQHPPVLHRVAQARRRLGPVGQHPPLAAVVAAQVGGGEHQRARVVGGLAGHDAQEPGVAVHDRRRQHALGQQPLRPVEVGEDGVEQLGALGQPDLQRRPLRGVDDERDGVQAPGAGPVAGTGVGDAVVGERADDVVVDAAQVGRRQRHRELGQALPRRAQGAVGPHDLVVARGAAGPVERGLGDPGGVLAQDRHDRKGPRPDYLARRRSRVCGYSSVAARRPASRIAATSRRPAVWPWRSKRAGAAGLGLVGVDRRGVVRAAAGVHDVVGRAAQADARDGVDDVEAQRGVHLDAGVQRRPRLPGAVAHAGVVGAGHAGSVGGGRQRHGHALAGDQVALGVEAADGDLEPLDRAVDVARGAGAGGLLAQHVPRLDGLAQLELEAALADRDDADAREAELDERREPALLEVDAGRAQVGDDLGDVGGGALRQQGVLVQAGPPAHQRRAQRLLPEHRDQAAHQQRLHQRHLGVRRHLEAAQLEQAEPPARGVGAVELVDAELGAVGVAGQVGQQVPQRPVDQPRAGLEVVAPPARRPAARSRRRRSPSRTSPRAGPRRSAAPGSWGR